MAKQDGIIAKLETQGFKHIAGLQATARQLWASACKHDGIPVDSRFVAFSKDNPFVPFHNNVMMELHEALATHVPGGGYVGLRIKGGKATLDA